MQRNTVYKSIILCIKYILCIGFVSSVVQPYHLFTLKLFLFFFLSWSGELNFFFLGNKSIARALSF